MRGGAPRRIVDLLRSMPGVADRLAEARVRREWSELVGPDVARQTEPLSLHAGTLIVGVASSPWLHQLTLLADELRARLNRGVGSEVIRELRFQIHAVTSRRASASEPAERHVLSESRANHQALAPVRRVRVKTRQDQARPGGGAVTT